jgi:dimethylhistidine N-methyltransferase
MGNAAVKLTIQDLPEQDETGELIAGLKKSPPEVSPKYFYDQRGSELFEAICVQPEYYPTRTELRIMREHLGEMAQLIGPQVTLIEYGSGASVKTRLLLDQLDKPAAYIPIDISGDFLLEVAGDLARRYPQIEILPLCADFTQALELPEPAGESRRKVVYFPGSTIGNFSPDEAQDLLALMREQAGTGGGLLIGVDLIKDPEILEPAYNDAAGVTADFNLNLLRHLNREFDADFSTQDFEHRAVYDAEHERIEMRLIATNSQTVRISGEKIQLAENEYIVTEHSHKFTREAFASAAEQAGFTVKAVWSDPQDLFSVQYLEAS